MKRTLHPKPNPVEFSPFETSFVPFAVSSFVKLSLQVGQASADGIPNIPIARAKHRVVPNLRILEIYPPLPSLASASWDASTYPFPFSKIT